MKKKHIVILLFILYTFLLNAQSGINEKYLEALVYLNNTPLVQKELKETFAYLIKSKNKNCNIPFKICPDFEFLPIYYFHHQLIDGDVPTEREILIDVDKYKKKYAPISAKQQSLFMSKYGSNSKIKLTFSPVVENYLIIEFLDSKINIGSIKMGPALQILFIYNSDDTIQKVLYAKPYYN